MGGHPLTLAWGAGAEPGPGEGGGGCPRLPAEPLKSVLRGLAEPDTRAQGRGELAQAPPKLCDLGQWLNLSEPAHSITPWLPGSLRGEQATGSDEGLGRGGDGERLNHLLRCGGQIPRRGNSPARPAASPRLGAL